MPPSNNADRLAKAIHPFLSNKIASTRLRALGWFDFISSDRPDTVDAVVMAAAAFLYLSLEDDGRWSGHTDILVGIRAFLTTRTGFKPSPVDLSDLRSLLKQVPVSSTTVEEWFARVLR